MGLYFFFRRKKKKELRDLGKSYILLHSDAMLHRKYEYEKNKANQSNNIK